jgi:hypothetical protein
LVTLAMASASAKEQVPKLELKPGASEHHAYDTLLVPNPDQAFQFVLGDDPETCKSATYCDVQYLRTVPPPGYSERDGETVLTITYTFDPNKAQNTDFAVWRPATANQSASRLTTGRQVSAGVYRIAVVPITDAQPSGELAIVTEIFAGVLDHYDLTFGYVYDKFDKFVLPDAPTRAPATASAAAGSGPSTSAQTTPPLPSTAPGAVVAPSPLTSEPGSGLSFVGQASSVAAGGAGSLNTALAAGGLGELTSQLGPPRPASGVLVAFWYGVLPAVALMAAGAFVLRRRAGEAALR